MHYRVRGNSVQLVKTVREEGSDKLQSKPVGSINLLNGTLNAAALAALTPEEVTEAKAWIANRTTMRERCSELELITLAGRVSDLAEWVRRADEKLVAAHSDEITDAFGELRKAMRKRGTGRRAQGEAETD